MDAEQLTVSTVDGTALAVTRHRGGGRPVLLLHAGVADRRAWDALAVELADDDLDLVAHDRRGFGGTPAASEPASFTHVDDLLAVLDALDLESALLVGNSMGGALALDVALSHPGRVSGVLAIGAGVSGMTDDDTPFDWQLDPASAPLLEQADDVGAGVDARVAALAHLWLDGPTSVDGRVGGRARELFTEMNRTILEVGAPDGAGDSGVDAWTRLGEVAVPVLSSWGALDVPADLPFYAETVRRLGQGPAQVLPGVAHLPGLERPELVADLVRQALRA